MPPTVQSCPIWDTTGDGFAATYIDQTRVFRVDNSPRAGGGFVLPEILLNSRVILMTDTQKAKLTSWLVEQRMRGVELPEITQNVIDSVDSRHPLQVSERADRLLRYLARQWDSVGQRFEIRYDAEPAHAWSESTTREEVRYFLRHLDEMTWIRGRFNSWGFHGEITVSGYARITEQATNIDLTQAFVAMWFDDSTMEVYGKGIELAVKDAGFNPLRIDRKDHINRIEDEIIGEIRRSRFLVADFTHGQDGARGGVYYEAGFAHGLNIPVIFTCRDTCLNTLHFDTAHYSHIVWKSPEDLREQLRNRIRAVIGQGPVAGA